MFKNLNLVPRKKYNNAIIMYCGSTNENFMVQFGNVESQGINEGLVCFILNFVCIIHLERNNFSSYSVAIVGLQLMDVIKLFDRIRFRTTLLS